MNLLRFGLLSLVSVLPLVSAGGCASGESDASTAGSKGSIIAVSSSYLAAAVTDLLGEADVVAMASPGMCPGHFDLRPSQIERLASAKLCLRFDFQKGLEQKLVGRLGDDLTIKSISLPGGMCVPASYEAACRQTADILVEQGFFPKEQAGKRLEAVTARMNELSRWMRGQVNDAGLADKPVVTSFHQAEFCRALGLNVVATLTAADTARASMLDKAVEAGEREGVKLIIANRPEGRRLADVVADRLGAKVIMFGNFPENDEPEAFDRLVRANVWALTEGAPR